MIRKVPGKKGKKSGIYKRNLAVDLVESNKDDLLLKLNYQDVGTKFLIVYQNTDRDEIKEEIYIYGFEGDNKNVISYYPNPL